jgi:hypothetical protein
MKTKTILLRVTCLAMFMTAVTIFSGCQKDDATQMTTNESTEEASSSMQRADRSYVFAPQAHMHGKSYANWSMDWWKWNLSFDCAHTPIRDVDGTRENQNQSGPVYFLAGRRGNTLTVTVPSGVSLFFPLVSFYAEDPCVDNGNPLPGETVPEMLTRIVNQNVNASDGLSLTIDGKSIGNLEDYKLISNPFTYSANADLANCYDGCLIGTPQTFVDGGYFVMLKPLSPGHHTIHRNGGASSLFPFTFDITYEITQL